MLKLLMVIKCCLIFATKQQVFVQTNFQVSCQDSQIVDLFSQYMILKKKQYYSQEEHQYRLNIFCENLKDILGNLEEVQNKIQFEEKDSIKSIVVKQKTPCDTKQSLNHFMDLSDKEFQLFYLLPDKFLDSNNFETKPVIEGDDEEFEGISYIKNKEWLIQEIENILKDPNFDVFTEALMFRQNKNRYYQRVGYDYEHHHINNSLLGITKYDAKYYLQQIQLFLLNQMPDYSTTKQMTTQKDDYISLECQEYLDNLHQQGRRLQNLNSFSNSQINQAIQNRKQTQYVDQRVKDYIVKNNIKIYQSKGENQKYFALINGKVLTFDVNPLTAPTYQQSVQNKQQPQKTQTIEQIKNIEQITIEGIQIPKYVNWRERATFTPVKDQRKCNACYAFGALGTLEAHIALKFRKQVALSEQEILDCSYENEHCLGGQPYLVFDYIQANGINRQQDYPYEARQVICRKNDFVQRYRGIKGKVFVTKGMINLLKALNFGPVSIIQYASKPFKFFYSGIFAGEGCPGVQKANHAATAYGYNLNAPVPYIMLKNNWGLDWGESGYYKLSIGNLSNSNLGICLIAETKYNVIPII